MRVANWNVDKALENIKTIVWGNARRLSEDQVADAKRRCPVGDTAKDKNNRFRPTRGRNAGKLVEFRSSNNGRRAGRVIAGRFVEAQVTFTRNSGRRPNGKGTIASFKAKRWTGRYPGQLRDTIRVVEKPGADDIRVYAGDFKVYYALFVERGTKRMRKQPFLRPSFQLLKAKVNTELKKGL